MKNRKSLLAGLGITVCAGLLVLRILKASAYLTQENVLAPFALTFVLWFAAVIAIWKLTDGEIYSTMLTAFGAVLSIANAAAIPLLYFTSLSDSDPSELVLSLAWRVSLISAGALLMIPLTWAGMYCIERWQAADRIHLSTEDEPEWIRPQTTVLPHISPQALLCGLVCGFDLLCAVIVFLFSSGGTTILFNVHFGVIITALCLVTSAFWISEDHPCRRKAYMLTVAVMLAVMVVRHETGLPVFFYLAFLLFYLTLHPLPDQKTQWGLILFPFVGVGGIVCYHSCRSILPEIPFLTALLNKIDRRVFNSDTVEQTAAMLRSLKAGGLWGSPQYDVYVSEASTDFILGTAGHYFGMIYLLIAAALFFIVAYIGTVQFTASSGNNVCSHMSKLGHAMLMVNIGYNLLMVCGVSPVLGVQCVLLGRSIMVTTVFSGVLMGMALYSRESISRVLRKE